MAEVHSGSFDGRVSVHPVLNRPAVLLTAARYESSPSKEAENK